MTDDNAGPEVGSVGEEAVKLLGALGDWAKSQSNEYADTAAGAANGLTDAIKGIDEHLATGGEDCRYCPVCRVIAAVRQTSPEVRGHLTVAASSLLQAAAGVMATQVPDDAKPGGQRGGVEKIDLDDEPEG